MFELKILLQTGKTDIWTAAQFTVSHSVGTFHSPNAPDMLMLKSTFSSAFAQDAGKKLHNEEQ